MSYYWKYLIIQKKERKNLDSDLRAPSLPMEQRLTRTVSSYRVQGVSLMLAYLVSQWPHGKGTAFPLKGKKQGLFAFVRHAQDNDQQWDVVFKCGWTKVRWGSNPVHPVMVERCCGGVPIWASITSEPLLCSLQGPALHCSFLWAKCLSEKVWHWSYPPAYAMPHFSPHILGSVELVAFRPSAVFFCVFCGPAGSPQSLFWFERAWACCLLSFCVVLRHYLQHGVARKCGNDHGAGSGSLAAHTHLPLPSAKDASGTLTLPCRDTLLCFGLWILVWPRNYSVTQIQCWGLLPCCGPCSSHTLEKRCQEHSNLLYTLDMFIICKCVHVHLSVYVFIYVYTELIG